MRTSIVLNLSFPKNTVLSCFFFFIIDLYFLIPAVVTQIFISIAELVIPTETQANEANAEIEMQPVTVENEVNLFLLWQLLFPLIFLSNLFISLKVKLLTNPGKLPLAKGVFVSDFFPKLPNHEQKDPPDWIILDIWVLLSYICWYVTSKDTPYFSCLSRCYK